MSKESEALKSKLNQGSFKGVSSPAEGSKTRLAIRGSGSSKDGSKTGKLWKVIR